jgi:hypothetical protein
MSQGDEMNELLFALLVTAAGLLRYVNDAYGESDVTLRVDVKGGVGEINLEIV